MRKTIIALLGAAILTSCVPMKQTKIYHLGDITIKVMDERNIKGARGYYNIETNVMRVPYSEYKDKDGNYLPNFDVLGHEIWHNKDLGERFHK